MTATAPICRLWMWHSSAKRTRKEGGRRGLRPWPLRCLSQILPEREDELLSEFGISEYVYEFLSIRIDVPFTDGVALYL